ncbi:MAG: hypothetical protein HKN13_13625 [Rhodothermales bacterium]|nr:hypothetical protein [Rhodothermales bacterium]
MGLLGSSRRPTPRRFSYQPRHYDPAKDRSENIKRRIRIKSKVNRGRGSSAMYLVLLLLLAVWIYYNF